MNTKSFFKLLTLGFIIGTAGCTKFCSKKGPQGPSPEQEATEDRPAVTPNYAGITVTNVIKRDLSLGKGAEAKEGSTVRVRYTEWVYDPAALGNHGPKIYETKDASIELSLGAGKVIKGIESGISGMKVNGKRQLIIPSSEAYGENGQPPKIPPNAMVLVDIELLDVR